jgi:hypothetical protein
MLAGAALRGVCANPHQPPLERGANGVPLPSPRTTDGDPALVAARALTFARAPAELLELELVLDDQERR